MRLIDAEKLLEDLKQKRYSKQSLELILNQPEIKATPVEWVKHWAMKNWARTNNPDWDIVVSKMIEDWDKENEKTDEEHN